jgi:hypothetical protein
MLPTVAIAWLDRAFVVASASLRAEFDTFCAFVSNPAS